MHPKKYNLQEKTIKNMAKSKIQFTKMHGAGNDYIYVNTLIYNIDDPAKASIEWSKTHFGVGSDGLILIGKATEEGADFSMRIFNNDGSEAMMCGNGTRCVAKYLHDKGLTDKNPIRLQTLSGIKVLHLDINEDNEVDKVTVDMGMPLTTTGDAENGQFLASKTKKTGEYVFEVESEDRTFAGTFVSMGNPHFVCFVEGVEEMDITKYGKALEFHPAFPERCNIEFAEIKADGTIRMRVWERGSGITLACGTGACATAVAASLTGRRPRKSDVEMDGGTLNIEWSENDNHIYMTGPAAISFEGEITLP